MSFCDPLFLFLFLPIAWLWVWSAPTSQQNLILLCLSALFYAIGEWSFAPWLMASTLLNFAIAQYIQRYRDSALGTQLLVFGIACDLFLLIVFKYADFLMGGVNVARQIWALPPWPVWQLPLPLGISFFTFHKISYKIDIWRGLNVRAMGLVDLALYILLFAQLIAGPIVRYNEMAHQLEHRKYDWPSINQGLRRFMVGLGKKMLLANCVGKVADTIFGTALQPGFTGDQLSAQAAWLGVVAYSLQIYFDFSGYSDMAIGLAKTFGFAFPENFNWPYTAHSISQFWRLWHQSLSRWFRDYLYIPLGGNRKGAWRTSFNLWLVFLLCGLWHGASWTFVIWGAYHGALLSLERILGAFRINVAAWLLQILSAASHGYTLIMLAVGWAFFRANDAAAAVMFVKAMFGASTATQPKSLMVFMSPQLVCVFVLGAMATSRSIKTRVDRCTQSLIRARHSLGFGVEMAQHGVSLAIGLACVMRLAADSYNPFIYYRF